MVKSQNRVSFFFYFSIALFLFSLILFSIGLIIKNSKEKLAEQHYEKARIFYRDFENEVARKAGSVIASNNISLLVYRTILRTALNLPYSGIKKYRYKYNGLLELETTGEDDMAMLEKLIRYGEIRIDGSKYFIRFF
ncbi:MAG: hypothetical protein JRJ44_00060 [Deltaproteobacteria bacterium]|nr:hypothetical protein [Deltaproteobacteria bacterium]